METIVNFIFVLIAGSFVLAMWILIAFVTYEFYIYIKHNRK